MHPSDPHSHDTPAPAYAQPAPGYPPAPAYAQPAAGPYPPVYGPPPAAPPGIPPAYGAGYPSPSQPEPPRRSGRAWLGWLIAALALLLVFGCVIGTVVAVSNAGSGGSGGGFGSDRIAVIRIAGTIAGTGSAPSVVTPEDFLKQLKRAEDDESVKAIVLRVDSPGGTVAASEEIATYVKKATKPIVVSVGDVDASGAYMISSQAKRIVANPGSAVGSIGVITEIPNVAGLLDKLGVQFKVIHAGQYKDAGSPFRSLTPSETALIQGEVDEAYGQFVDIVAEGRHLPRSKVESLATGWAWNAVEAKDLGLVDKIGTYQDALDTAAKLGHIEGAYDVTVYEPSGISGILGSLLGIESQLQQLSATAPGADSPSSKVLAK